MMDKKKILQKKEELLKKKRELKEMKLEFKEKYNCKTCGYNVATSGRDGCPLCGDDKTLPKWKPREKDDF